MQEGAGRAGAQGFDEGFRDRPPYPDRPEVPRLSAGDAAPRYPWKPIPGSSHEALLRRVEAHGTSLRLLDLGCGAGELGRRVRDRAAFLAGIEPDAAAAAAASSVFDRVVAAPLPGALDALGDETFDLVVAGDVLEHLAEPSLVLSRLTPFLAPGGALLVSLPNVANVTVRLGLLLGRFDYAPRGILDATHLRFFTRRTGRALLESAGYRVVEVAPTAMPVELALPALGRPPLAPLVRGSALLSARLWPTLFGYQFVFEAVPA